MMTKILGSILIFILLVLAFFIGMSQNASKKSLDDIKTISNRVVYTGAWVGGFWDNETKELTPSVLSEFEQNIGHDMAIANIYSEWSYLPNKELVKTLHQMNDYGWTPMISANPFFFDKCKDEGESLYKTIADGKCDEFLRDAALNLKSYDKPVFFRFAWEMNLPDMYWSVDKTKSSPSDFSGAWKKMYQIFEEQNARNVIWVLSFNTSHSKTTPYEDLFPGDSYVDWVAIDGYNWGDSHDWSGWADFNGVFRNSYDELTALTDKPVMISEVNSAPTGGNKAKWLTDMLTVQIPENFEQIEAIMLFNENKTGGESVDWRLEKSPEYIDATNKGLSQKLYKSVYP